MDKIKSGKELCDDFFDQLVERTDIESNVAILVKDIYSRKQLTTDRLRKALKALRQEKQDEQKNKN